MSKTTRFELSFWGGTSIRYKRYHPSMDAAKTEAYRVLAKMANRAAHPAVIYMDGKGHPVSSVA